MAMASRDAAALRPHYQDFLESKIVTSVDVGLDVHGRELHPSTFPHQVDAIRWALRRGRALIAMSFGLGKTHIQCEVARLLHEYTGGKFLVICPLGVKHQFTQEDGPRLGVEWQYVRTDGEVEACESPYLITNYERVRDGSIDPRLHDIAGVSLDEGSVLRSLGNKTSDVFKEVFADTPYRFVCTATPAPNEYREIIYYATFLGVMDHGQALAQPLNAKVLTPSGWVEMGDIQAGDCVIAVDGLPTKVLGVYPQGEKRICRVGFSDGSSTECTEDHLWLTRTQYERANERRYRSRNGDSAPRCGHYATVKTTDEIARTLKSVQGSKNHEIPMVGAVEFDHQEIGLDPWLLGFLLGDGYLRDTSIQFTSKDMWLVNHVRDIVSEYGLKVFASERQRADGQPCYDYSISNGEQLGPRSNRVLVELRSCGLLGKRAWEKAVPEIYLYNTSEVRLAVLQGLMDADGTICKDGTQCRFTTTSQMLAEQVKFIVESLGGTVYTRERQGRTPSGEKGRKQYRVTLRLPNEYNPFSLPRKADLVREWTSYPPKRFIVSVDKAGTKKTQCIMVEHPAHLYVTDDFVVTHNTRWFKRDVNKAGNLKLHPQHEEEFWLWVASWGLFVHKPSDLGYDDTGYELPKMHVHWHRIDVDHSRAFQFTDNRGQHKLLLDPTASVSEAAKEKRATLPSRLEKLIEIIAEDPDKHWLLWHQLEDERRALEKGVPEAVSVYGALKDELKEERVLDFSRGNIRLLATKPQLSGFGCNFQRHCHSNVFLGVSYKFEEFIQAIHRTYRFQQEHPVDVHIIYAESEEKIVRTLKRKWGQYDALTRRMQEIVCEYGLSHAAIKNELQRNIGVERLEERGDFFTAVLNDCVLEMPTIESDSVGLLHTSIPFGNHYEYTTIYNDFGHNQDNAAFWDQMDYVIPELLRVLKPGRVAAIHVKDRVLYGHQTPTGFMEIAPFSDECVMAFRRHGFLYEGRRTIVTDVVRENNSTYRLGWTEMTRDASKMGCGLPEYLLLFRKPPTSTNTQRADEPVIKDKEASSRGRWQIDAHAFWQSSGNSLVIFENPYDYEAHVARLDALDERGNLPASFFYEPPTSRSEAVWDDVQFMRCLNSEQSRRQERNHICPLPLDIVQRVIRLYSNPDDVVLDPFAGLFTVPYVAIQQGRYGIGIELSDRYFHAGARYCREAEQGRKAPTLFDFAGISVEVAGQTGG